MTDLAIKASVSNLIITRNMGDKVCGKADLVVGGELQEVEFEANVTPINLDLSGSCPVCDGEEIEITEVCSDYEGDDFDDVIQVITPQLTDLIAMAA